MKSCMAAAKTSISPFFKSLLESHGLKLNQVQYLPDEPDLLVKQLRRSFSDGLPTFVTGGIGSTPDDHTRQAAAAALDLPVVRHPEAAKFIEGVTRNAVNRLIRRNTPNA